MELATQAMHVQRFSVRYEYPVFFTEAMLDPGNLTLVEALAFKEPAVRHRVFAVIDLGVAHAWPRLADDLMGYAGRHAQHMELVGQMRVPGGEAAKNNAQVTWDLLERLHDTGMDRHSVVLAIGGGAVTDMAGFAAATAHRGIRVIRAPTTVLAQNDVGVGVKNAINAFGAKNFVGTFAPPFAVVNDACFIDTLAPRDRTAGMAEAVKVAVIRDAAFFAWMEHNAARLAAGERAAVTLLIRRTAELHLRHIAEGGDPFESGTARPLDYGHWAAHKLEMLTHHELRHGEAVAIGMALDTRYAVDAGMLAPAACERVLALLARLGLPLWHPALGERGRDGGLRVLDGLAEFREHLGGPLTLPMLVDIGRSVDITDIDRDRVGRAVEWLARPRG